MPSPFSTGPAPEFSWMLTVQNREHLSLVLYPWNITDFIKYKVIINMHLCKIHTSQLTIRRLRRNLREHYTWNVKLLNIKVMKATEMSWCETNAHKRTWIFYEINHDGPVVSPIWSSGESSPIIRRNQPKHNVKEKRIALSRTQFQCFRLAFHSFSFLLCSSRQPYNSREFSNLWLGTGAPTRSAHCAAAQAAHPCSRTWFS
jgi:hypothetical protein